MVTLYLTVLCKNNIIQFYSNKNSLVVWVKRTQKFLAGTFYFARITPIRNSFK